MTVFAGTIPIGALIAGWVTGHFGAPLSIAAGGTMVVVAGLYQIWSSRQVRRAGQKPTATIETAR
jgi:uncharacterized membrane protein YfcA